MSSTSAPRGGKSGKMYNAETHNRSVRAGLVFPVGPIGSRLRRRKFAAKTGSTTAIAMAAALEYITMEVLTLAKVYSDAAKPETKRIIPRHIQLAIQNDAELKILFRDSIVVQGGVVPEKISSKKAIRDEAVAQRKKMKLAAAEDEDDPDLPPKASKRG